MPAKGSEHFLPKDALPSLIDALHAAGYRVIGPTVDQEAIVYDEIRSVADLPRGWTEVQAAGTYRLQKREDDAFFGYTVGPHSPKRFLFPPHATVATAEKTETGWQFQTVEDDAPPLALVGVRACELAAIGVQDRTFLDGPYVDPIYRRRRESMLLVAVNCTQAASTCFCTSMNTGPRCTRGFDLALTEIVAESHRVQPSDAPSDSDAEPTAHQPPIRRIEGFLIEVGSDKGHAILDRLSTREADRDEQSAAESARQQAVDQITKQLDTTDIRDLLLGNLEHPRWEEVASRCLSCTNCTMVCPTCFCSSVQEVGDLRKHEVQRERVWDSCFNFDFSYMNGGIVRNDIRSRYRQWLTHKLASWHDQFDVSGCVGCGRCITWCPVGIDLTEEVAAIRGEPS